MRRRHPRHWPKIWLMTDPRMGDALLPAIERLPRGSGIVFRHLQLRAVARKALFDEVAKIARRRRHMLLVAGKDRLGRADGAHNGPRRLGPASASAHSRREAITAIRAGVDLLFVSPVYPTRSHPGARALAPVKLGLMIRGLPVPVIALGGMTLRRARGLTRLGIHGWAAIDAWLPDQNLKAVPI